MIFICCSFEQTASRILTLSCTTFLYFKKYYDIIFCSLAIVWGGGGKEGKEEKKNYTKKRKKRTCKNLQRIIIKYDNVKSISYKLELLAIIEVSPTAPMNRATEPYKQKLINPHPAAGENSQKGA